VTSRERVDRAFRLEPVDRVPIYQAGFSSKVASYVLGREAFVGGGIQQFREAAALWAGPAAHAEFLERSFRDACELCEKLDLDLVRTMYWRKCERPAANPDPFTFRYDEPDGGWEAWRFDPSSETFMCLERSPRPEPGPEDLRRFADEALRDAERHEATPDDFPEHRRAVARFGATRGVHGGGIGLCIPREPAWLEAAVLEPETVGRFLDAQVLSARKCVPVMVAMGLRHLFGGGDFAGNRGPLYSPRTFHELMLPRLRSISEACAAHGALHLFASDGDLWPVADDLFGASGVGGFYEVDGNYMPLRRLRGRFPRLVLLGGIRSGVLHRGSEADVIEETRSAVEDARAAGGCIVGCSNQVVAPTPERNFWAMMETLERCR